jgi:hypothetical protein
MAVRCLLFRGLWYARCTLGEATGSVMDQCPDNEEAQPTHRQYPNESSRVAPGCACVLTRARTVSTVPKPGLQ